MVLFIFNWIGVKYNCSKVLGIFDFNILLKYLRLKEWNKFCCKYGFVIEVFVVFMFDRNVYICINIYIVNCECKLYI